MKDDEAPDTVRDPPGRKWFQDRGGRPKGEGYEERIDPALRVGLSEFADALRLCLGLHPIYGGGRHRKKFDGEKGPGIPIHDPDEGGRWVSRRLCRDCAANHHENWDEMWSEYYRSQGF